VDAARALRDARRRAGLTQAELAARAATSQAAVSAYESAAKTPSVATLSRLLAAAGARLTVEATDVLRPTAAQHARAGRTLGEVLELAEALPTRHERDLRFPRLPGHGSATG
jgi:transcriptional regulator with XRE-family HTH domain